MICAALTALIAQAPMNFDSAERMAKARSWNQAETTRFASWYGAQNLERGAPRGQDRRFVFAIQTGPETKSVVAVDQASNWKLSLRKRGGNVWSGATTFKEGHAFRYRYEVDGKPVGGGELEAHTIPPEGRVQPNVPQGTLSAPEPFMSKVYPGTTRQIWTYVPKQYDPSKPACLFVIQDGQWQRGYWKTVMDNMIHQKDIPVSIGVFLSPGVIKTEWDNRSIEFDTVSDRYVTMLADEILPMLEKRYNLRKDAKGRLIGGASSGAICAFNAAWHRPDLFHKVVSWIGSYTNLQGGPEGTSGGNTYPAKIRKLRGWDRKGEPKPIRVFLQDGLNDVDNAAGSWPIANQDMARALEYGGYDYKFLMGNGFHSDRHGQSLLPDTLRWIWRDEPKG